MNERIDDFEQRRAHLKGMSDAELKAYFLELADKIVDPLLDLAYKNTSKSIERSVLLRMGFNSLEAKGVTDILNEHNLLRKGAGQCVFVVAKEHKIELHDAGLQIQEGEHIDFLKSYFEARS